MCREKRLGLSPARFHSTALWQDCRVAVCLGLSGLGRTIPKAMLGLFLASLRFALGDPLAFFGHEVEASA